MAHFYTPVVYIAQCAVLHSIKASPLMRELWRLPYWSNKRKIGL